MVGFYLQHLNHVIANESSSDVSYLLRNKNINSCCLHIVEVTVINRPLKYTYRKLMMLMFDHWGNRVICLSGTRNSTILLDLLASFQNVYLEPSDLQHSFKGTNSLKKDI